MSSPIPQRPISATHGLVAGVGLFLFLFTFVLIRQYQPFLHQIQYQTLFLMVSIAAGVYLFDLCWQKVHLRPSTGLSFLTTDRNLKRSLIKYVGLLGSLGSIAMLYWLFPEYHSAIYNPYYHMLKWAIPVWLILGLPYIYYIDSHMRDPHDGYWMMGQLCIGQWRKVDRPILIQHGLGWLVKGFFFPLMFIYLCSALQKFIGYDLSILKTFPKWFDFLLDFMFFIDVGLACHSYFFSFRLTDTHCRSTEPTMLGWVVALVCYQPLSFTINSVYFNYSTSLTWGKWLWNYPLIYGIWGCSILLLTAIYVWATIMFGARFSNLTHRGIITNGPYQFFKHPAYWSKNITWWLISVPFVIEQSAFESLRHCILLLMVNGLYALRAWTEARHLSQDPEYQAYSLWISEYGVWAKTKRFFQGRMLHKEGAL